MNLLSTTRALLGKADSYRRECRDTDRFKTCQRDKRFKLSSLCAPPQTTRQRFVYSEPDRTYDTERFDDKSLRTLLQQQTRTTHINSTDDLIRRQHTFTIQQAVDQHKEGILGRKAESRQKELHNRTAERMVGSLLRDQSALALHARDPEDLVDAVSSIYRAKQNAFAISTRKKDLGSNWDWWEKWCNKWDTPAVRDCNHATATQTERDREAFLLDGAGPFFLLTMKARGRMWPQPDSAMKVLEGIRRVHSTWGYEMPPLTSARKVIQGIKRQYVLMHGPESIMPHRQEPLPFERICGLRRAFGNIGLHIAATKNIGFTVNRGKMWASLRSMVSLMAQSGLRKAEVTYADSKFTMVDMARGNVAWIIDGQFLCAPTLNQFLSMVPKRDFAAVFPPPSKADQFGVVWGNMAIYLMYDPSKEINAATDLRSLEINYPIEPYLRRTTPLYTTNSSMPLSPTTADNILKAALTHICDNQKEADRYSWHSFRIALACSMLKAGCTSAEIQACCRWQTDASLKIYARLDAVLYTQLLDRAYAQQFTLRQQANMPRVCMADLFHQLRGYEQNSENRRFSMDDLSQLDEQHNTR